MSVYVRVCVCHSFWCCVNIHTHTHTHTLSLSLSFSLFLHQTVPQPPLNYNTISGLLGDSEADDDEEGDGGGMGGGSEMQDNSTPIRLTTGVCACVLFSKGMCVCVFVYVCACVCMSVSMRVFLCVCARVRVRARVYEHTDLETQSQTICGYANGNRGVSSADCQVIVQKSRTKIGLFCKINLKIHQGADRSLPLSPALSL